MAVYALPDLPYDYAVEPHINGQILELAGGGPVCA